MKMLNSVDVSIISTVTQSFSNVVLSNFTGQHPSSEHASAFGLKYDLNAALAQTHHTLTVSLSLSFFVVSGATATRAVRIQAQPAKTS